MSTTGNISKRAEIAHNQEDFLLTYMNLCNSCEYDCELNPEGYINLGTGVSNISNDILHPKITSSDIWSCDTSLLQYSECHGILRFRKAIASFMTVMMKTSAPVNSENIFCTNGVTGGIDLLAHCLADPGDVIMTPTPVYGRIYTNLKQRSLVDVWPIPIIMVNEGMNSYPVLTLEKVKAAFFQAIKSGKNVRGIFLINPNNPMGTIYSPHLMLEIFEFCQMKNLHIIVDEVYALSVFDEEFHSVLSYPVIPDPEKTHVLYGLSKDFALAGLRIGIIHTMSPMLKRCLLQLTNFQEIPFPVMKIAAKFLEDLDWCKAFTIANKERLCKQYEYYRRRLEKMGCHVYLSKAGFFLWVNFKEKCCIKSFDEEFTFFEYLIKHSHLYIVPGKELFCLQPGWYRISFTGKPDHIETAFDRLESAVKTFSDRYISEI